MLRNGLDSRTQDALYGLDKTVAVTVMGMDGGRNTCLGTKWHSLPVGTFLQANLIVKDPGWHKYCMKPLLSWTCRPAEVPFGRCAES